MIADFLFTATAVVVQPITGVLLAWIVGYSLLRWLDRAVDRTLPAHRRVLAAGRVDADAHARSRRAAARAGTPLPAEYHRLFRLGSPSAFRHSARWWPSSG